MLDFLPNEVSAFISAELLYIIVNWKDIDLILKRKRELTQDEQYRLQRGLRDSIIREMLIPVPASVLLMLMISPLFPLLISKIELKSQVAYAILGMISYGFPFVAIRRIVTTIALNTLKEFASLSPSHSDTMKKLEPNEDKNDDQLP